MAHRQNQDPRAFDPIDNPVRRTRQLPNLGPREIRRYAPRLRILPQLVHAFEEDAHPPHGGSGPFPSNFLSDGLHALQREW